VLRPREPLDGVPVPVIASPAVAKAALATGRLTVRLGAQVVPAEVAGTARLFPSVDGDFVVADLATWLAAANAIEPGTSVAGELWLDAPASAAPRLARPPFAALEVSSQSALEQQLRGDPLARGSLALLLTAGAAAIVLAVVGVLLAVAGDVRDESGELFDLELQGASPRELQRHLLVRTAVVGVLGLVGGVAAGAVVSALVVSVVTVTAGAERALPSLQIVADVRSAAAAVAVLAAAVAVGSFIIARGAYASVARRGFSEGLE
jgi:predicted lysophospholipase L1 biosynthesis ABC-type transport system permease subunit